MSGAGIDLASGAQLSDKWTDGVTTGTSHAEERHVHSSGKHSEGHPQTLIQFVLDDQDLEDDPESKKEHMKTDLGYSPTILLSAFYVIIVSLVGVCFPIAEAIKGQWQVHHWVAAFMVYLYVVSTAFLLYVQIYHLEKGKNSGQEEQNDSGQIKANIEHDAGNLARPKTSLVEEGDVLVVHSKNSQSLASRGMVNEAFDTHGHQQHQPETTTPGFIGPRTFFRQQKVPRNTSGPQPYIEKARRRSSVKAPSTADPDESDAAYVYLVLKGGTASLNHHGGASIYLKVGILLFSLANLLYTGLQIKYYHGRTPPCGPFKILYPYYFQMLFVVVQTFFVFKNTTVVIRNHKGLVRFGVMHVLATNLCTWLRFLGYEIMEAIHEANHDHVVHPKPPDNLSDPSTFSLHIGVFSPSSDNTSCNEDSILKKAAPYLFPFILEYSLIAVAVMAGIYSSLNIHITPDIIDEIKRALRPAARKSHHEGLKAPVEGAIFTKSHLGIFLGFMLLAAIVVCIILFFYWNSKPDIGEKRRGDLVFQIADLGTKSIMMAATIAASNKLFYLGFDIRRDNQIDHILLGVSLAGLFLNDLFSLIAGFYKLSTEADYEWRYLTVLNVSCGLVTLIQSTLQAILIIDGLERFAETDEQVEKKPGRSLITFLIIANVVCWIYQTVLEKKLHIKDELDYLGSPAWPIVQNLGLPLVVFFRFHSSICLAEMWHSAYVKDEEHMDIVEEHVS